MSSLQPLPVSCCSLKDEVLGAGDVSQAELVAAAAFWSPGPKLAALSLTLCAQKSANPAPFVHLESPRSMCCHHHLSQGLVLIVLERSKCDATPGPLHSALLLPFPAAAPRRWWLRSSRARGLCRAGGEARPLAAVGVELAEPVAGAEGGMDMSLNLVAREATPGLVLGLDPFPRPAPPKVTKKPKKAVLFFEVEILDAKTREKLCFLDKVEPHATIAEIKNLFTKSHPQWYPARQSLRLDPKGKSLKDEDVLQKLPVGTTATLYFRDLGAQISWTYYWGFAAWMAYYINHPLYTPPTYGAQQVKLALAIFVICQLGNFSIHMALRNLRPAGSKTRKIPFPTKNPFTWLFMLVSCPNYTYEVGSWIGFTIMTQCLPVALFSLVGFTQMTIWAKGKHRSYLKEFRDYPSLRSPIIPFLL
ncbi:PREDICTED: very-long-chain enoyl-CoA reductase [Elephantulus edwardii]|uniref:very-long-chain enoyl-CoA reductase n=1 Tax=Elephantulus edwardii TaxID=28737 RepID=UPI0003F09115|nr:PREDICTED: very-long-chain enoyl-CoA reductase [Elephantulus edwardii]